MTPPDLRAQCLPRHPVLDVHTHPPADFGRAVASVAEEIALLVEPAKRCGVSRMCLFSVGRPASYEATIEQCVAANDCVRAMHQAAPGWFVPFCYLTPIQPRESVAELERRVGEQGFAGVKLWVARPASDPALDPILRRATELGVPVLQHAWVKTTGNLPHESVPADVADLARRHPGARIIMAHLVGCGLRGLETIADCPNIAIDTAGGDPVAGVVETAVEVLGPHRVVYGSDAPIRHFGISIGKVLGARIPDGMRRDILWNNTARMLPPWSGVTPLAEADDDR